MGGTLRSYESPEVSTARLGFSERKYDFPIVDGWVGRIKVWSVRFPRLFFFFSFFIFILYWVWVCEGVCVCVRCRCRNN